MPCCFFSAATYRSRSARSRPPGEEFDDFEGIYSSSDKLGKFLQSLGPYSPAVFVLLQVSQVIAAPVPGELTGVAGGYVYGETFGFILSTVGLALGSWIAFELASILGRPFVERFVSQDVLHKFDFLTTNTGATICFLLFLIPGFPKDYLCYLLGLSRMKLSTFLLVSIIGRAPGTYMLTAQGAKFRDQEYYEVATKWPFLPSCPPQFSWPPTCIEIKSTAGLNTSTSTN